jgi:hypothetical protein
MKLISLYIAIPIILSISVPAVSTAQFAGGTGTPASPYQIETVEQLQAMKDHLDKHFILMNDIDASATAGWNGGSGFEPIRSFNGTLDGNNFIISHLGINRPANSDIGLFGSVQGGSVINVRLNDVAIHGGSSVGAIVGYNSGVVLNSAATGSVTAGYFAGGLIGHNSGTVVNCSFIGIVKTNEIAGGLIGNNFNGLVSTSYAFADVSGHSIIGGLVGASYEGEISDCYSSGSVTGTEYSIGGLIGSNVTVVRNCYSTSYVSWLTSLSGGLIGSNSWMQNTHYSYWDTESSGHRNSYDGQRKTSAEMTNRNTFTGWDFSIDGTWIIDEGQSYPYLRWQGEPGEHNFPLTHVAPSILSGQRAGNSIMLSWNTPSIGSPVGYNIYRNGEIVNSDNPIITTEFVDEDIDEHLVYTYGVTSVYVENGSQVESISSNLFRHIPSAEFDSGDGSINAPFQIATVEQLQAMQNHTDKAFILVSDIDAASTEAWNGGEGFMPIGNYPHQFYGLLDGNGYSIKNLYINTSESGNLAGLIGYSAQIAEIKNIIMESAYIVGSSTVGSIAGRNKGTIRNCHTTGTIVGYEYYIGGLVGDNEGQILESSTAGEVIGYITDEIGSLVGGLAGGNSSVGKITESYSSANVTGKSEVGGLTGRNEGIISNSYATGNVAGFEMAGGLVGLQASSGSIYYSYATGWVTGPMDVGGLVGKDQSQTVMYSYWNTETSGQSKSKGGSGITTAAMRDDGTFLGWDFSEDGPWNIEEYSSYPFLRWQNEPGSHNYPPLFMAPVRFVAEAGDGSMMLRWQRPSISNPIGYYIYRDGFRLNPEIPLVDTLFTDYDVENHVEYRYFITAVYEDDGQYVESLPTKEENGTPNTGFAGGNGSEANPYQVESAEQLNNVRYVLSGYFQQTANIDLGDLQWMDTDGWVPIGDGDNNFKGQYDGNEYYISGLIIKPQSGAQAYFGLFGYVGNEAIIQNVGLVEVDVDGVNSVGGLAGWNAGTIRYCYTTGNVYGATGSVGGLVGTNSGSVSNSYSVARVGDGTANGGGLIGSNQAQVSYTYAGGPVDAPVYSGGLLIWNSGFEIQFSYWDRHATGQTGSAGGEGLPTTAMLQQASFFNWDFNNIWTIIEGATYPYLRNNPQEPPPAPVLTSVNDLADIPTVYSLFQNYPNPFNPSTIIRYGLPDDADVRLVVYDMLGRQVAAPVSERQHTGFHEIRFEAGHLAGGMYIYRLNAGEKVFTRKMLLVK